MNKIKLLVICCISLVAFTSINPEVGAPIDNLDGIPVYYNGNIANVFGRNITEDGYNLGLKYQCVEFVKRYYFEKYQHRMPDSYGHAKDFFLSELGDKGYNHERGLMQYKNIRSYTPQKGDILIFNGSSENPFGHMGIVSKVTNEHVEIIQQNWGTKTRHKMKLVNYNDIFTIADFNVLGWLRKE